MSAEGDSFFVVGDSEHQHHGSKRLPPTYPQVHQHEVSDSGEGWYKKVSRQKIKVFKLTGLIKTSVTEIFAPGTCAEIHKYSFLVLQLCLLNFIVCMHMQTCHINHTLCFVLFFNTLCF